MTRILAAFVAANALASDGDGLTSPDFASRAIWADKYPEGHRETAAWHFVDVEIDRPGRSVASMGRRSRFRPPIRPPPDAMRQSSLREPGSDWRRY